MAVSDSDLARSILATVSIVQGGYDIVFVEYCEDARTPGLLGHLSGVTDHAQRQVKISLKANDTPAKLADTLEHEARHVADPTWDCGNRDVLGRGGIPLSNAHDTTGKGWNYS
jgi:hypothetical protein